MLITPTVVKKAESLIDRDLIDISLRSLQVSLSALLIASAISIPLGIRKAVKDGSGFDTWTSGLIIVAYAIPGFLFAILLLVLFALPQAAAQVVVAALILAGALFSFTISFDDITATLFWATAQNQTVPVKIFSMLRNSISPEINALGAVMIVLTVATPLLAGYLSRKFSKVKS